MKQKCTRLTLEEGLVLVATEKRTLILRRDAESSYFASKKDLKRNNSRIFTEAEARMLLGSNTSLVKNLDLVGQTFWTEAEDAPVMLLIAKGKSSVYVRKAILKGRHDPSLAASMVFGVNQNPETIAPETTPTSQQHPTITPEELVLLRRFVGNIESALREIKRILK